VPVMSRQLAIAGRALMTGGTKRLVLGLVFVLMAVAACSDPNPSSGADATAQSPAQQSTPAVVSPTPVAVVQPVVAPPVIARPPVDPYAAATAAGASAVCADGTWSYSQHRSGTCSSHGGVHWWTGNLGAAGPGAH
jgi:hypothetical protein